MVRMVAPNSVGDQSTLADDVVIDGKIMTGQDDPTAREMGRQLAGLAVGTTDHEVMPHASHNSSRAKVKQRQPQRDAIDQRRE